MGKILLNKRRSKNSSNTENNISLSISENNRLMPLDILDEKINEYERYISEKKASNTYRLSFNITPLCSNVLFNNVSEIVYHEGSDDCLVFNANGLSGSTKKIDDGIRKYCNYKDFNINNLNRFEAIRDTAFSHADVGGVVYHCGYDIFNNHTLRKKEFNVINKLTNKTGSNKQFFNTLLDYQRDYSGKEIVDYGFQYESTNNKFKKHQYQIDNVLTFEESINENLIENNGWVGFINPTTLNIDNYVTNDISISLNKCMNNNKPCEMIDMYPDRSLFSFIPKINKYRQNRVENNWDYCLTYPYEKYYNELVEKTVNGVKVNGLECVIVDDIFTTNNRNQEIIDYEDTDIITLKTFIKNGFKVNTMLDIVLIGKINGVEEVIRLNNIQRINSLGVNGRNKEYYFKIYGDELLEHLNKFTKPSETEIRVRKVGENSLYEYYFRVFKRIPNFKNTDVYIDGLIDKKEINKYCQTNFNSTINGMAFSRTIYNDRNAQILFNDDVKLDGLRDNLGRKVSEIFLTIVKNNQGNKEWYDEKNYTSSAITYSRCFGEVTSGIDMKDIDKFDYNIHKIHNIPANFITDEDFWDSQDYEGINNDYKRLFKEINENGKKTWETPIPLERDINIKGGYYENSPQDNERDGTFLGDIVEFNLNTITENILEDVYHRFNTKQREIIDGEYGNIYVDDIVSDDYDNITDINGVKSKGFIVNKRVYNGLYDNQFHLPVNLNAEGYYYKPHHRIVLKEYSDTVKQGYHTLLNVVTCENISDDKYSIILSKNFYLEPMEKIYLFNKFSRTKIIGTVLDVGGEYGTHATIKASLNNGESLDEYIIFKHNIEKPDTSIELNDGSGRYLWKDFKEEEEYDNESEITKYTFTNNAHYINKNIIFSLHRQDPSGEYNINNSTSKLVLISNLAVAGKTIDYSDVETLINDIEEGILC